MARDREELPPIDPVCEHCDTPIIDARVAVARAGATYCCANCARADDVAIPASSVACAHCGTPIVDRVSMVEENGSAFCCVNCAAAGASPATI